ncbi:MAG: hypothetical protein ACFFCS_11605 [Candidatus Hodarchaeota archaeon]
MKLKERIIWLGPIAGTLLYLAIKLLYACSFAGTTIMLISLGVLLGVIALVLFAFTVGSHPVGQIIFSVVLILLLPLALPMFIQSRATAHWILTIIVLYETVTSTFALIDAIRNFKDLDRKYVEYFKPRNKVKNQIALWSIIAIAGLGGFTGLFSSALEYQDLSPQTFVISNSQAQGIELVSYLPTPSTLTQEIVDIFQLYNVCWSFDPSESALEINTTAADELAAAIQMCMNSGVKVELWPLFSPDDGHYPSLLNLHEHWPRLYEKFYNFCDYYNVTVDYFMWDVEYPLGTNPLPMDDPLFNSSDAIEPWKFLLNEAENNRQWARNRALWSSGLQIIRELATNASTINTTFRATTHTGHVWDLLDGDNDLQQRSGLTAWDLVRDGTFQYCSQMAYRGCEGGGNSSSAMIYKNVQALERVLARDYPGQDKPNAVCIGCIAFDPYPTVASIVDDVRLSIAAGAEAVRIFQLNSWRFMDGGHAVNDSSGESVLDIFKGSREGGSVTYYPSKDQELNTFVAILGDVLLDLCTPIGF